MVQYLSKLKLNSVIQNIYLFFSFIIGHYNCGGVGAAHGHGQYGLIDNWLRNIKDVYRRKYDF